MFVISILVSNCTLSKFCSLCNVQHCAGVRFKLLPLIEIVPYLNRDNDRSLSNIDQQVSILCCIVYFYDIIGTVVLYSTVVVSLEVSHDKFGQV